MMDFQKEAEKLRTEFSHDYLALAPAIESAFKRVWNECCEDIARSLEGIVADWPDKACESGSFLIDQIRAHKQGVK